MRTRAFRFIFSVVEFGSDEEEVKPPQKLEAYSIEFKLKVVKHAKEISKHSANIKYGVSRSCVQDWVTLESKLHQIQNSSPVIKFKKKPQGGGRPLMFKDFDRHAKPKKDEASRGWLERFLVHHNFRIRAPTTVCQKPPSNYVQQIVDFLLYITDIQRKHK
uniref:HTH CENPB-type domain-containing protein n=1 Tax=Ditylenchus dipsaci TaxID=166011 RepID=A0A915EQB3_9BILA